MRWEQEDLFLLILYSSVTIAKVRMVLVLAPALVPSVMLRQTDVNQRGDFLATPATKPSLYLINNKIQYPFLLIQWCRKRFLGLFSSADHTDKIVLL